MKRFLSLTLALCLALSSLVFTVAAAENGAALSAAHALKSLGLFKGTDKGLELDRAPTRMEAIIMLIRLTGVENDALSRDWSHPFEDAPTWQNADKYLGYAYQKGMTKGVDSSHFDPESAAGAREVATLTLRALGYTDDEERTVWEAWDYLCADIGLIPEEITTIPEVFTRGKAAQIYYTALDCKLPKENFEITLAEKLINNGVFTKAGYTLSKKIAVNDISIEKDSLDAIATAIYAGAEADFSHMRVYHQSLDAETAPYYIGADNIPFTDAMACEPMMLAQAHSVCLVRVKEGTDIEAAKSAIRENVDPRKWICVGVEEENIRVVNRGNLILLVMDNNCPDALVESFMSLNK